MYQKQSRNANRSADTIASFLLKTYEILEHPEYERMICWDKSNVGFVIQDVVSFTKEILPKYFRHSNFSSFVRQLNMYDFHKVKQQNDSLVFKNPLFCKGQQHNLKFIRRKAAKKICGQRRQQSNEKQDVQNEKYQSLLRTFKKSIETQINQSSLFYERSIQLMKEQNDLRLIQAKQIENLYNKNEAPPKDIQRQQSLANDKNIPLGSVPSNQIKEQPISAVESPRKPLKDTVIKLPLDLLNEVGNNNQIQSKSGRSPYSNNLQSQQILKSKSKQSQPQAQPRETPSNPTPTANSINPSSKQINPDTLFELKEQCYKYLGICEGWLNDYIQIQSKKFRCISNYKQQLKKCFVQNSVNGNEVGANGNNSNGTYLNDNQEVGQGNVNANGNNKQKSIIAVNGNGNGNGKDKDNDYDQSKEKENENKQKIQHKNFQQKSSQQRQQQGKHFNGTIDDFNDQNNNKNSQNGGNREQHLLLKTNNNNPKEKQLKKIHQIN